MATVSDNQSTDTPFDFDAALAQAQQQMNAIAQAKAQEEEEKRLSQEAHNQKSIDLFSRQLFPVLNQQPGLLEYLQANYEFGLEVIPSGVKATFRLGSGTPARYCSIRRVKDDQWAIEVPSADSNLIRDRYVNSATLVSTIVLLIDEWNRQPEKFIEAFQSGIHTDAVDESLPSEVRNETLFKQWVLTGMNNHITALLQEQLSQIPQRWVTDCLAGTGSPMIQFVRASLNPDAEVDSLTLWKWIWSTFSYVEEDDGLHSQSFSDWATNCEIKDGKFITIAGQQIFFPYPEACKPFAKSYSFSCADDLVREDLTEPWTLEVIGVHYHDGQWGYGGTSMHLRIGEVPIPAIRRLLQIELPPSKLDMAQQERLILRDGPFRLIETPGYQPGSFNTTMMCNSMVIGRCYLNGNSNRWQICRVDGDREVTIHEVEGQYPYTAMIEMNYRHIELLGSRTIPQQ